MPAPKTVPIEPDELARRAIAIIGAKPGTKHWRVKFGEALDVTPRTISRWENHKAVPLLVSYAMSWLEVERGLIVLKPARRDDAP